MKWIKIVLSILGVLILAIGAFVFYAVSQSNARMAKTYAFNPEEVPVFSDSLTLERGKHQAYIRGCVECHGANFEGKIVVEDPAVGRFVGSNISGGAGSVTKEYSVKDWVRSIRYGVNPQGRPLVFMASEEFYGVSDADLSDLISYMKSVSPVDNVPPAMNVGTMFKVIAHLDRKVRLLPVEMIDFSQKPPASVMVERTAEYGKYLAVTCTGCHGSDFSGGKIPGVPPDWPAAANLTKTGLLKTISTDQFKTILRTGIAADGHAMNPGFMPWPVFKEFTDLEMEAMFLYLSSL